ncbi:hypothetical protein N7447_004839 [Penicillium robsamsonii]|uniref:uncharacterized protein n=1 Tax=Penicillium robsamsonii TaxID=1792511 RepID=UPI00254967E8|nr:uncharacterized protein N7447_004839 [Penicillium robsamsonii]KAJ5822499.1 hypothetical protein N7447_004839 [Penicillium robsamsonii]
MEPAQVQLAHPLPSLSFNFGTSDPSIHSERVSLEYMHQWNSFVQDAFGRFQRANITHQVDIHDENELYIVMNELGLSGRFVRNLCDPVMRALEPLSSMSSMRFADIQAITHMTNIIPNVSLGPVNTERTPDNVYLLRGPPPPCVSNRLRGNEPRPPQPPQPPQLPLASIGQTITLTSVILDYGQGTPMVINCVQQLSDPNVHDKAVWLADLNGTPVIIKCWKVDLEELFDSEAVIYERIWTQRPSGAHVFANWISRGRVICSSVFPSGYALVLEYRDGARLSHIWHTLNELERAHIKTQSLNGINALRQIAVRLSDAGMHNMLYNRQSRIVTLLDIEVAVEIQPNAHIPTSHEMGAIFGSNAMLGHEYAIPTDEDEDSMAVQKLYPISIF